jgi:hypothetical protein
MMDLEFPFVQPDLSPGAKFRGAAKNSFCTIVVEPLLTGLEARDYWVTGSSVCFDAWRVGAQRRHDFGALADLGRQF